MAMIKKLSLQGVRSFSPQDTKGQWIEFGSPLTLILGVNGSGKTTIIEALKFAVTSQFPPNSAKGASFVNDPKLNQSSGKAVAKIQLDLEDNQGNQYYTTRKFQTTVKNVKGDLSMTQLEGTLRFKGVKGDSKEISNKVADIKYEMSRLMGVSEAVLSYVIFCHQEESCWPLDEGKKVKVTFDAIFNTLAYKKCFDRLQTVDKDLAVKIKVEAEGLRYVKENRLKARSKQLDLDEKRIELQVMGDNILQLESSIKEAEKKIRQFQQLEEQFAKEQSEVAEKRATVKSIEGQIKDYRSKIKEEFHGSISELRESIKNFNQEVVEKNNECRRLERDYTKKDVEWKKLDQSRVELVKQEGMFQQEEDINKSNVEKLDARLLEIVSILNMVKTDVGDDVLSTSFSDWLKACDGSSGGDMTYESVTKALNSALKLKDSELQRVKEDFDSKESRLQAVIDEVRGKLVSKEKEREMKRQQMSETKKAHEDLKVRLRNLEKSCDRLAQMDEEEQTFIEQIEQIENSGFMLKCDSEIKDLTVEVKKLEEEVSKLSETVNILALDKGKTDQISLLNRQKMQKQNECNERMRQMEDELKTLLEVEEVPEDGLVAVVDSKASKLLNELKDKRNELKSSENKLATSNSELKFVSAELKKQENALKVNKTKISTVLDDKDYNSVYTEVAGDLEEAQQTCYFTESAAFVYKKYIQKLGKKDCCPLCKRDQPKDLTTQLIKELENDITRMKQNVPKLKEDVEKFKKRQQQILKCKPIWDECQDLEKDRIPKLKAKKAELEENVETLTEANDDLTMLVSELETNVQTAQKYKSEVAVYESTRKEIKKIDDSIAKLERQRDPEAKNASMTLADAQAEHQQLQTKVNSKRSEKEMKEDIRNKKRDELAKLQEKKNKVKEDKLRITAELQNREGMEQQKKELESTAKELQTKINELGQSLPGIKTEITKAEKDKTLCQQRRDDTLKHLRDDKTALDKQKDAIAELNKKIQDFEKKRGRFSQIQQRVADCKENLRACEEQKKEIEKQINIVKKDLSNQELKKRELEDNLSLKEKLEEVSKLKADLQEKEQLLSQAENKGAATEKRVLMTKHHKESAKFNELSGSRKELQRTIKELEKELQEPRYASAEKEYTEKVAKKTVFEKAQRDVRRYKTALDQAIMQFHNKKMEKINKILYEYWRRIYKGNDIDRIMIKTEADQDPAQGKGPNKGKIAATSSTRKNYNYRVVMVRRGVEIDMRGRCSAGQRVLASIIIRIALAESFGARCGIMTLDEPTTNLDQKNINSLADALADLAEKMASRRNFQLIVITHDQEFTERLTGVDAVEKYWKVDRDKEGYSQITMVPKRGHTYGLSA